MGFAVKELLEHQMANFPTKNALRVAHQDLRWAYGELHDHAAALGAALLDLGVAPGDAVGAALGCSAEHVAVQLGAAQAGIKVADVVDADKLSKDGLTKMLQEQRCTVLFVSPEVLPKVYEAIPELAAMRPASSAALSLEAFPALKYVVHTGKNNCTGTYRFRDILLYNAIPDRLAGVTADKEADAPLLELVDGNTGAGAGVATQHDLLKEALDKAGELKLDGNSRVMLKTSKDQPKSLLLGTLACATKCSQFVVAGEKFDAQAVTEVDEHEHCDTAIA
ncbi:Acyl-CoA ligase SID4 (Siderophore biosynthesis cluster protein SID4) [Durusdinium trenchii]|uniref:Acyl-CoA ligase SID4 (Siderophore biosynthesis cluster protein SID4) n=1 Tax=Durusdinium trenchii TaxID=1381693 RepID=A0ABP0SMX3_9DINO